jgi:hypothetical protein
MRLTILGCGMVLGAVLTASPGDAAAGKFFDPGAGLSGPVQPASCARSMTRSTDPVPWWSLGSWSLQSGAALTGEATAAVVAQGSVALWLAEWRCAGGTGLFADLRWRRWSVALSGDAMLLPSTDEVVLRPSIRLARAHVTRGLLSFGSEWTPMTELFVNVGPTLDYGLRGGSVSLGGRASVVTTELRVDVARDGEVTVLVLAGVTDVHGLWKLGPLRSL